MFVTLVLTRTPLKEFKRGGQSGRWGELVALKGPRVSSARLSPVKGLTSAIGLLASGGIPLNNGVLQVMSTGGPFTEVKRFTSMERFKADNGNGYYVQLRPKPEPYTITYESGNSAVKKLRNAHDGRCFRVHGGRPGPEQGILIHEAPHVGWVIGCISPRPLNNFTVEFENAQGNPSYRCMDELFQFVGRGRADFFVLDW